MVIGHCILASCPYTLYYLFGKTVRRKTKHNKLSLSIEALLIFIFTRYIFHSHDRKLFIIIIYSSYLDGISYLPRSDTWPGWCRGVLQLPAWVLLRLSFGSLPIDLGVQLASSGTRNTWHNKDDSLGNSLQWVKPISFADVSISAVMIVYGDINLSQYFRFHSARRRLMPLLVSQHLGTFKATVAENISPRYLNQ